MTRQTENTVITLINITVISVLVFIAILKTGTINTDLMFVIGMGMGIAMFSRLAAELLTNISRCSRTQAVLGASLTLFLPIIFMMLASP